MQTIVDVKNLNKNFYGKEGEVEAIKNITFSLEEGQILTLLGPSGCELCNVTRSVISRYECNRYNPTKEVFTLLSFKFDMHYLYMESYTKLIYDFDEFLDRSSLWIKEDNLTKTDAATKLGISRGIFRFWFNGGIISISTYNKIKDNLNKYNLL